MRQTNSQLSHLFMFLCYVLLFLCDCVFLIMEHWLTSGSLKRTINEIEEEELVEETPSDLHIMNIYN